MMPCVMSYADYTLESRNRDGDRIIRNWSDEGELLLTNRIPAENRKIEKPRFRENEEPQPVSVHVQLTYPEGFVPVMFQYGPDTYGQYVDWTGEDTFSWDVYPYADYPNILMAYFVREENPDEVYLVIKELDELVDGVEVSFDAEEATEVFEASFLDENGEPFSFAYYEYDPETKNSTILQDGELGKCFGTRLLFMTDGIHKVPLFDKVYFMYHRVNAITGNETDLRKPPVVHTNRLPSYCGIITNVIGFTADGGEGVILQTNTLNSAGTQTNDPDLFKHYHTSFMPLGNGDGEIGVRMKMNYTIDNWFYEELTTSRDVTMSPDNKYVGIPVDVKVCLHDASMKAYDMTKGFGGVSLVQVGNDGIETDTMTRLFDASASGLEYVNYNTAIAGPFNCWGNSTFLWQLGSWTTYNYNDFVNPYIPADVDSYLGMDGNSTPMLTFVGSQYEGPCPEDFADIMFDYGIFNVGYMGRQCEYRETDLQLANVTYTKEGNVFKYLFENKAALIDGEVEGCNITELGSDFSAQDIYPPTVQYLMFYNKGGYVTDRFANPEDGSFGFYAGDFYAVFNEDYTEFQMDANVPATLKVEYAPFRSDEWKEMIFEEDKDMFFMPGFGYRYRGNLEMVEEKSGNGWFDMRFTLKDDTGNWQIQTLSPAFRIDSADASVGGVFDDSLDVRIVGRDIIVPAGASVYDISGLLSDGRDVAPGVYIVRKNDKVTKIVVR